MLVEALLVPVDTLRNRVLRGLSPLVRPLIVDREIRIAAGGTALVLLALALTVALPLWLLAASPILWGVPHLLADVRYLIVRPGYHLRGRRALWLLCGVPLFLAGCGGGAGPGLAAVAGAAIAARGSWRWRCLIGVVALALAALALWAGYGADLLLAHAHNLVAVALWWTWRPRKGRLHHVPLLLFVLCCVLLLGGQLQPLIGRLGGLDGSLAGMDVDYHLEWIVPDLAEPMARRILLCFAFAQAVHYGIWVRLIPDEDRQRATPRTFAASYRALRADLGAPVCALFAASMVLLCGWAVFDLMSARAGYFRVALFHGPLELCAAALFLIEGRPACAYPS